MASRIAELEHGIVQMSDNKASSNIVDKNASSAGAVQNSMANSSDSSQNDAGDGASAAASAGETPVIDEETGSLAGLMPDGSIPVQPVTPPCGPVPEAVNSPPSSPTYTDTFPDPIAASAVPSKNGTRTSQRNTRNSQSAITPVSASAPAASQQQPSSEGEGKKEPKGRRNKTK